MGVLDRREYDETSPGDRGEFGRGAGARDSKPLVPTLRVPGRTEAKRLALETPETPASITGQRILRIVRQSPERAELVPSRPAEVIPTTEPGRQRSPTEIAIREFRNDALEQSVWRTAQHFADGVHPGAGLLVAASYVAVKALDARNSLRQGSGFYLMIPATVPGTDLALSVGIRELSPDFGARFRISLMEHSYVEGAPNLKPAPAHRGDWPGEWTLNYGWAGIRDHSAVLARKAKVIPANHRLVEFADAPKPYNSMVWEIRPALRTYSIVLPGHEPKEVPY